MQMLRTLAVVVAGAVLALLPDVATAQGATRYPSKVVRIVVPFPAGGGTDLMARNVAQKLNEMWKQPVVVENRAGAGGMIGADVVAKSPADGYTYLVAATSHSINATLVPQASYDLQKDLRPVAILGLIPLVAIVPTASPFLSLKDLVLASHKKTLNAGSGGNGTIHHLALELFKKVTGARIQHVAYRGDSPAMTDLLGGQIDLIFMPAAACLPLVKSGKLRALAVTTEHRFPLLPDVPTTLEAGFPGVQVTGWNGLLVASGTSREIVARIHADVTNLMSAPDMKSRIVEQGFLPIAMGVGDTESFVRADIERWRNVIRDADIKAD